MGMRCCYVSRKVSIIELWILLKLETRVLLKLALLASIAGYISRT